MLSVLKDAIQQMLDCEKLTWCAWRMRHTVSMLDEMKLPKLSSDVWPLDLKQSTKLVQVIGPMIPALQNI